jgi:hypothetical protein
MPLSKRDFEAEIKSAKILYFPCEELNTPIPHYFVCVCIHPPGTVNLSCCTSQFETVKRLIERGKYPNETLVYIPEHDTENPFNKKTYINCNEYFPYLIDELWDLYQNQSLEIFPELPLDSFEQIIIGFQKSPIIEEELKENLPDVNDF